MQFWQSIVTGFLSCVYIGEVSLAKLPLMVQFKKDFSHAGGQIQDHLFYF
jgi:hypothetical protein